MGSPPKRNELGGQPPGGHIANTKLDRRATARRANRQNELRRATARRANRQNETRRATARRVYRHCKVRRATAE